MKNKKTSVEDQLQTATIFEELKQYFGEKQNQSEIRVRELIEMLTAYLSLARMREDVFYEKYITEIKTFRAPMSRKDWELIVEHAILKDLYNG